MAKKVTLKDVAHRAGVSYQTVSKVLRGQMHVTPEVSERIYAAVRDLSYRPNAAARNLRTQASKLLGYSWEPEQHYFFNPVLEEFQQSIVEAAEELGYHILLFPQNAGQDLQETYRELVYTGRVDGFVLSGLGYEDPRVRVIRQLNMPVVAFGRTDSTPINTDTLCPYVDVDGQRGMYQAVQHLIALGHTRIAAVAWPTSSRVGEERLAGYFQAMQEAGLAVDPDWIVRGEGEFDYGYQAAPRLLDLPPNRRPTAFATMMDLIGIGVIRALEERGLVVGRDVGVTGFDDQPVVRYFKPGLTTLRQPIWEVGQQTIRLLVDLVQGNPVASEKILLEPELILRESTQRDRR